MFDIKLYAQALDVYPQHYVLVNVMVARMRQLQSGAEPLVESEGLSLFDITLREIVEGKIVMKQVEEVVKPTLTLKPEHLE
ncbi:MAG: DNA-directed RNA polymerase subunit omega [Nitrospinae bacterium]|nr:DNA-directed RNA polymerase subunit omega [Nitrospinota bacterium]